MTDARLRPQHYSPQQAAAAGLKFLTSATRPMQVQDASGRLYQCCRALSATLVIETRGGPVFLRCVKGRRRLRAHQLDMFAGRPNA